MDEEIDLRPYIELLIRRWYIIVGAAVLAGLITFGVISLQDKVYQATSLIAVTQDRLVARFDPRLDTSEEPQPLKVLPELATSDDLLRELKNTLEPPLDDVDTIAGFRGLLEASPGDDPSLIRLTAKHTDPADAARISNQWAAVFVIKANELFGDGDGEQLNFFEDQRTQAEQELTAAESALIEFQGINRQTIHGNKVNALSLLQQTLLEEQRELRQLESSVQYLRDQIADSGDGNSASFADQLTALVLQLRVFNPAMGLPFQLQLDGASGLSSISLDEQTATLMDLQKTVTSRLAAIGTELTEMEPQLLELQQVLQETLSENNRLQMNRNIAQETYQSLARKVDEEGITSDDMTRGIRLASNAAVPEEAVGPQRMFITLVGAFFGAILAVFLMLFISWWKSD